MCGIFDEMRCYPPSAVPMRCICMTIPAVRGCIVCLVLSRGLVLGIKGFHGQSAGWMQAQRGQEHQARVIRTAKVFTAALVSVLAPKRSQRH